MSFDPEITQPHLDEEREPTKDLRERYGMAPVFERVRKKQIELNQRQINSEDIVAAWHASQEFIRELDAQAKKENVFGQPVQLSGDSLELPEFQARSLGGDVRIGLSEPVALSEQTIDQYYGSREIDGIFAGFTMQFARSGEETYTPHLSYQVVVAISNLPHAYISLFATGAVNEAQLSFKADEKMDKTDALVEQLYELCEKRLGKLNRLHVALASTKNYDATTIRRIAFDAAKVLEVADEHVTQHVEDRLIDLVAQYIEPGSRLSMKASSFTMDAYSGKEGSLYRESNGEDAADELQGSCKGFIFLNKPIIQDDAVTGYQKHKTLHAVLEASGQYAYVPLTDIQEFENL